MQNIKKALLLAIALSTVAFAGFDFGGCSGSDTFTQTIERGQSVKAGDIPQGIEGLVVTLTSNEDVDIQLFDTDNNQAIVAWSYLNTLNAFFYSAGEETKDYLGTSMTYSGFQGTDGNFGHEFIRVNGTTPANLEMKAFGYVAGTATVEYSWTGKVNCETTDSGTGTFNQEIAKDAVVTIGEIPANISNLEINLTAEKDVDIQLFGEDGTPIIKWNGGLIASAAYKEIDYNGMHIVYSGFLGVGGQKGHEYIKVTNATTEALIIKAYGYEAGEAVVTYSWGEASVDNNDTNTTECTIDPDLPKGKSDGLISLPSSGHIVTPTSVVANGIDAATYTLTLKDYKNLAITKCVNDVVLSMVKVTENSAVIGSVDYSKAEEGIYSFEVRDTVEENVEIEVCVDYKTNSGAASNQCFSMEAVEFSYSTPNQWKVSLSPESQTLTVGETGTISVKVVDANNQAVGIADQNISLLADEGSSISSICETNASGECTITVTDTAAETVVYTPRANGTTPNTASNTATVAFTPGVVNADMSTITANPTRLVADGVETSTVVVTAKDVYGNLIDDATVSLSQGAGHSLISDVTNNNNGTYNFSVSNATIETVVYRATINGLIILQNVSVIYDETTTVTYIASIYDNTPYNPAIDYQGVIDASGHEVLLPYTVAHTVSIPAYSQSKLVSESKTSNDESGLRLVLSYPSQTLTAGSGNIVAHITVNDIEGDEDGTYNARKIDVDQGAEGVNVVSWDYHVNTLGAPSYVTLKITAGIPDRMFGKADNNGDTNSHDFLYLPVTNPATGRTWLNNNLGADYTNIHSPNFNPGQQAKSQDDYHAYGSLFQWGRKADGHELIRWTSNTNGTGVHGSNGTNSNNPTHALFIPETGVPYDWRINQDDTLWASESSTNNICPIGYRVPRDPDWYSETQTWSSKRAAGALSSTLALPMPGFRSYDDAIVYTMVDFGYYWSGSVDARRSRFLLFSSGDLVQVTNVRAHGFSIRCIKD